MKKNQELIRFRKLARSILPGHFLSKGVDPAGLEFQGLREYEPGESTETIDWNASGTTYPREVLMRLGERRRNIMVIFVVDATRSMESRRELISAIWEALYEEASEAGHQVAWVLAGKRAREILRPNVGGVKLARMAAEIPTLDFAEEETNISQALAALLKRYRAFSQVAVVISDLLFSADYKDSLRRFRRAGNETAFLILGDQAEEDLSLPLWSFAGARDSETGEDAFVKSSRPREEVIGPHIAILNECGAGWALIDETGTRQEILEEKLRQAFNCPKTRKEAR